MSGRSDSIGDTTWSQHIYKILATAAFSLLAIGTVAYHFLEDWSWVDSVYFATVAVTTVGFGDLVPTGDGSKLFTVVYILIGMTIITSYLHARFGHRQAHRLSESH